MKLVMTLMVRDEEDILGAQLDYHLAQGVDFVLAVDDGSVDATPAILAEYERRGVLQRVPAPPGRGHRQGDVVTAMARLAAAEHDADWVLNADADEFFWPVRGTLADTLDAVPAGYGTVAAPRNDFLPTPPGPEPFWRRMTVRESASISPLGYRLVPKTVHRAHPDVVVERGNHYAHVPGLGPAPPLHTLEVLHFPMRSFEQFDRKTSHIGRRLVEHEDPEESLDQASLYERQQRGELAEWYAARVAERDRVRAGLMDGSLLEDLRLANFFERGSGVRERDPAALVQTRDAYERAEGWYAERIRAAREQAEAERDDAQLRARDAEARVGALEEAYAEVDGNLRAERAAHFRTAEDLRLLRESRAVRIAGALRRARASLHVDR